jgi:DNA polymerase beta
MNKTIVENFDNLINDLYLNKPPNFSFKINSFKKARNVISSLDYKITIDNINNIKEFSDKIKNRIKEILTSGKLSEVSQDKSNSNIMDLTKITGIGPSKAKELIKNNITLEDLLDPDKYKEHSKLLTHHQKIGVLYYNDLQKKIPQEIIKKIQKYLNTFDFEFTICGSFRRNKHSSGDIDILVKNNNNTLEDIINILSKSKFLVAHLTSNSKTKYMGVCKFQQFDQYMRIDIRHVTPQQYPYAILYFTGSKNTNTYMRNIAIKLGFKLNEYGLFNKYNDLIELKTEQDIFECLNIPYLEPQDR